MRDDVLANTSGNSRIEDRGLRIAPTLDLQPSTLDLRSSTLDSLFSSHKAALATTCWILILLCFSTSGRAQQPWYFHTINSHSLAAQYGRTYKINYAYQLTNKRQLKLSGIYVFDEYSQKRDRVKADIYNLNLQFQYVFFHFNRVFINGSVGAGGYSLKAGNLLNQRHKETKLNFIGGLQAEYYFRRSTLAVIFDYDVLYMPFSRIYEFLHLPSVGVALYF